MDLPHFLLPGQSPVPTGDVVVGEATPPAPDYGRRVARSIDDVVAGLGLSASAAGLIRNLLADPSLRPADAGRRILPNLRKIGGVPPVVAGEVVARARAYLTNRSTSLKKGGPFIGPRGGKWADSAHTIPWGESGPQVNVSGQMVEVSSPHGTLHAKHKGDHLAIVSADVDEGSRGKGHGVALYQALASHAANLGLPIHSDVTVEDDAAHVWEALRRRGHAVQMHPKAAVIEGGGGFFVSGGGLKTPVFTMSPPEPAIKKGGPYLGPQGGKWADPQHTISWHPPTSTAARVRNALGEAGVLAEVSEGHGGHLSVTVSAATLENHQAMGKALRGWSLVGHQKAGGKVRLELAPVKGGAVGAVAVAALAGTGLHGKAAPGRDPGTTVVVVPGKHNPAAFTAAATAAMTAAGLDHKNIHVGSDNAYVNIDDGAAPPELHHVATAPDQAPIQVPQAAALAPESGVNPAAIAQAVAASLGMTTDQVRAAVTNPKSPHRDRIERAIYDGGHAIPDAVLALAKLHDKAAHTAAVMAMSTGDVARIVKEFQHTPTWDVQRAASFKTVPHKMAGQAYCTKTGDIVVGHGPNGDFVTGDFRHELGHAVHFGMITGDGLGAAVGKEWAKLNARRAQTKPPPGGHTEEWAEIAWGAISDRDLDTIYEHAAEHYRGYHRELLREKTKKTGGGQLATYRQRHPGWAKIWDARYTAALLGATAQKGDW